MEVDILYDPVEIASLVFLPLTQHHQILGTPHWLQWLRDQLKNPDLMLYCHRETDRFVLCHWLYKPHEVSNPIVHEIEGFTADPSQGMWPRDLMDSTVLLDRMRPVGSLRERDEKRRRDRESEQRSHRGETLEARKAACSRLRQNGLHREARLVEIGAMPFALPSADRRDQWIDVFRKEYANA